MDIGLKDKVVMIAAASRGLGFGIARAVAMEGAKVSIASPTESRISEAASNLRKETGADVVSHVFDARDGQAILDWHHNTCSRFGGVDALVVNAGGPPTGGFDDFIDEDWQDAYELTLLSSVRMIRSVLPSMRRRGGGSILTVTSSSVKEPIDILLLSNVMRSGVTSLAKSLSTQLAHEGIRVNNLVPGSINTDRLRENVEIRANKLSIPYDKHWEELSQLVPLGRFGEADEFGRAAAFLISNAASYITGETLVVDGGAMKTVW